MKPQTARQINAPQCGEVELSNANACIDRMFESLGRKFVAVKQISARRGRTRSQTVDRQKITYEYLTKAGVESRRRKRKG